MLDYFQALDMLSDEEKQVQTVARDFLDRRPQRRERGSALERCELARAGGL